MAQLVDLVRPIPIQVACFRLMTELVTLRIPMMLIVSVVVVVLLGLEPGIVCLAAFAAVRIVVVIRSTSVASAQSALLAFHPIRQPRTLEVIRAMVEGIARLSVSLLNLIPNQSRRDSDAGLLI